MDKAGRAVNSTERAEKLAERLGVDIPGDIPIHLWPVPLLEKIVDRLEKLEGKK